MCNLERNEVRHRLIEFRAELTQSIGLEVFCSTESAFKNLAAKLLCANAVQKLERFISLA